MEASTPYRADIDGLRAVAVLAVVFYHFDVWPFTGGFVGVDVFFVISGYLITQKIMSALNTENFVLLDFYARRFRRILPALLVVIIAALIGGWFILLPQDYAGLGSQAAFAAFGFSNFYFLWNTGYFARAADLLPLLHTWSLAVEEQFYLFWPIVVALLHRLSKGSHFAIPCALSLLIVISFAISVVTVERDATMAFFMLHTRAWELALGALLVFAPVLRNRLLRYMVAIGGITLIAGGVFGLNSRDTFPGFNALLPCMGAALLIWPTSRQHRLLSIPPLVWTGLISYSLYLWHWPLLAFFRHYSGGVGPTTGESALLLIASFAVAAISWRYIERPFRHARNMVGLRGVGFGLAAALVIALAGTTIVKFGGVATRLPPQAQEYARYLDDHGSNRDETTCELVRNRVDFDLKCLGMSASYRVLLLGDSHAAHFRAALPAAFPKADFISLTVSGCRPVLEPSASPNGNDDCKLAMAEGFERIIPEERPQAIVLAARWRNGDTEQLEDTVTYLKKFTDRVIVFGQTVEYNNSLPALLAQENLLRRQVSIDDARLYSLAQDLNSEMQPAVTSSGGEFYSLLHAICPNGPASCKTLTTDGVPIAWDYGHYTTEGAEFVLARLKMSGLHLEP